MNVMDILVACDNNYSMYATTMIKSVCKNHTCKIRVWLMHTKALSSDKYSFMRRKLSSYNVEIVEVACDELLDEKFFGTLPVLQWSIEAYFRLVAYELLPRDIKRVLWLDCDIIVQKDITQFYTQTMGENLFVACEDLGISDMQVKEIMEDFSVANKLKYCNSGVLLINLEELREKINVDEILSFLNTNANKLRFPDQDCLNVLFKDKIKHDDAWRYNCIVASGKVNTESQIDEAYIIHLASTKPWKYTVNWRNPVPKVCDIWWKYAKDVYGIPRFIVWKVIDFFVRHTWQIIWHVYNLLKR